MAQSGQAVHQRPIQGRDGLLVRPARKSGPHSFSPLAPDTGTTGVPFALLSAASADVPLVTEGLGPVRGLSLGGLMEDVAELKKLAEIARELATSAFDFGARERFMAAAAEYEERARLSLDILIAPSLVPATS